MSNLCFSCGQLERPILYLNAVEKMELDRLLQLGDWRAWAKKVLEHSEPNKIAARSLLHDTVAGKLDPEEFARRSQELSSMLEENMKAIEKDLQLRGKKE